MKTELIQTGRLKGEPSGSITRTALFEREVEGVEIELVSMKGRCAGEEKNGKDFIDVMLALDGSGWLEVNGILHRLEAAGVARIPYAAGYVIGCDNHQSLSFIRLRKFLDEKDIRLITGSPDKYRALYLKAISSCPAYKEDIKSEKTLSRMILPEGLVPRMAVGSVETMGPDEVGEHEHPMLEQVFLGLEGCRCICHADGKKQECTENMLLHIPLGSRHHVTVDDREKLAYIWMDFFLSLEGEKYLGEKHRIVDQEDKAES